MSGLILSDGTWLLVQALQVVILGVMIARRLHRVYAAFFAYMGFHVVRSAALYSIAHSGMADPQGYRVYFYTFWSLESLETILAFVVVAELYFEILLDVRDAVERR